MITPEKVRYAVEDGVAVLTLCDPPANTYSYEMMQALDAAILRARMDEDVHVLLLIGDGDKFFCAGADIKMLTEAKPAYKYAFCLHANETLCRLEQTPKLVVAALNGHCVGGHRHLEAADLRVARRGAAKVGLPEVNLGVLPGTGGTQRLARLVGPSRAIELMVHGRNLTVDEAHRLGLVNEVLEGDDFRAAALAYAKRLAPPARAGRAVGLIKRAVVSGLDAGLDVGLALERELQQQLFLSEDAKEGLAAYVEKRPPRWRGR